KVLTTKSDLYSLGVVFYELLTGEKPFHAESPVDMFMKHVNEPAPRPSWRALDIPKPFDTLVIQLMEKKPEHRFLNAERVAEALEEVVAKAEEKKSAGLDAVQARVGERRVQTSLPDETDRDAARAIKAALHKKKPRKKVVPLVRRGWFVFLAVMLALAGMGGVVWLLTRPPSPDDLYARADKLMAAPEGYRDALERLDGKDGPGRRVLRRPPNHPPAPRVVEWRDTAETHDLLTRLKRLQGNPRFKIEWGPIDENYRDQALQALRYEEFGDLPRAFEHWNGARKLVADGDDVRIARRLAEVRSKKLAEDYLELKQDDEKAYRKGLLEQKLAEAGKKAEEKRLNDAVKIVTEMSNLYKGDDDKDVKELVEKAKALKDKWKPPEG